MNLSPDNTSERKPESSDVHRISFLDREIILIGTAHVSKRSTELVRDTILSENPDHICLELDQKRYETLTRKKNWESLNLVQVIRQKQLVTLIITMILSSYQKKLSLQTGSLPGSEFLEADRIAGEKNIPVTLADRDARITLKRAWRKTSFYKKALLLSNIVGSLFDSTSLDEDAMENLKQSDIMTEMFNELSRFLPGIKEVLIDERDMYIANHIRAVASKKVLAVVGAGHVKGIIKIITEGSEKSMEELNTIPNTSFTSKFLTWFIPITIISALISISIFKGFDAVKYNIMYWIVVNGSFSAIGAVAALSHPLTILAAFIAAPLTSLNPAIGAGTVTAIVQVFFQPPTVKEIQNVSTDFSSFKMWWKNKTLKIFLAFLLPSLGSMIGTYVGGYAIIKNLFQ